jgi:hypothetical protein
MASVASQLRFPPSDPESADVEVRRRVFFRIPLELLDDCVARRFQLDQLRDLVLLWITERPNDPVPKTIDELVELLVR